MIIAIAIVYCVFGDGFQSLKDFRSYHSYGVSELSSINGTYHISKTRKPSEEGSTPVEEDTNQLYQNTYTNDSGISQPIQLKVTNHSISGILQNHQRFHFVIANKSVAHMSRKVILNLNKELPSIFVSGHYVNSNWWVNQWKHNDYDSIIRDYDSDSDYTTGKAKGYKPNNILLLFYRNKLYVNFSGTAVDHFDRDTQNTINKESHQSEHNNYYDPVSHARATPIDCQQVFTKNNN